MKIIILGDELSRSHNVEFQLKWLYWLAAFLICFLLSFLVTSWVAFDRGERIELTKAELGQMQQQMLFEQQKLNEFYTYADTVFTEHAKQAGNLQARVARVEALGGRLADMADFGDEFDFYTPPAVGGPDEQELVEASITPQTDVLKAIGYLNQQLSQRENELKALESLLADKQLSKERYLAGKPVASGWLSSHFGKRIDPFHGRIAWHKGVDFAGKDGTDILVVASGVVVWSGDRYGFGQMVEVDHGNGFATRYAHNKENKVVLGDVVSKGQVIAQMGSSGRSTGPHVHFEVLKHGKAVDPARYIYRKTL